MNESSPQENQPEIDALVVQAGRGDPRAESELFALVYTELKKIAKNRIAAGNHWAAQTTTLVNEAFVRISEKSQTTWENRHHFFWIAARAMRDILVERARHAAAEKSGGKHVQKELHNDMLVVDAPINLIDLNDALERFATIHPTSAKVVELKFFAGLKRGEIAEIMGISESTVGRKWSFARSWLLNALDDGKKNCQNDSFSERFE